MAARIAARRWVKAAWELPYIYISICLENNNPRGGRGEALAEPMQGGFLGGASMGRPPIQNETLRPDGGVFAKRLHPGGFHRAAAGPQLPATLRPQGWTWGGCWRGSVTPNPPQKGWSKVGSSFAPGPVPHRP